MTKQLIKVLIIALISIASTLMVLKLINKNQHSIPDSSQLPKSTSAGNLEIIDYKISIE
ncbi:MAG: hypothetical protein O3A01_04965 [bacterium]|nr:hypothetical protein [bacterium]